MSKHTPGPWHLVGSDNATPHIQHEQGDDRTDIGDLGSRVCVMPAEIAQSFNSWANARLIAAAPDLLAALEAVLATHDYHTDDGEEASDRANAAISKATGEPA